MAKKTGGFLTPFHELLMKDITHPAFAMAHFINGFVYATDATILIRQSLRRFHGLEDEQVNNLEGKKISYAKLKALWTASLVHFRADEIFYISKEGIQGAMAYDTLDGRTPDFEQTLPTEYAQTGALVLGINPELAARLYKAMGSQCFIMHYSGEGRAILVTGYEAANVNLGLIMPTTTTNAKKPF
jgi:hypothetical protein